MPRRYTDEALKTLAVSIGETAGFSKLVKKARESAGRGGNQPVDQFMAKVEAGVPAHQFTADEWQTVKVMLADHFFVRPPRGRA